VPLHQPPEGPGVSPHIPLNQFIVIHVASTIKLPLKPKWDKNLFFSLPSPRAAHFCDQKRSTKNQKNPKK
jgi:hypothetical protein